MFVGSLWRYPVKSLQGEMAERVEIGPAGVRGDRGFGILDLESRTVVSAKRDGRLLQGAAHLAGDTLTITLPGALPCEPSAELDGRLSRWRDRPSRLVSFDEFGIATFEGLDDFESDDSPMHTWIGPEGSFADSRPVHLLGTAELDAVSRERPDLDWDVRRFRPNVVVDDAAAAVPLAALPAGTVIEIGEVWLRIDKPCQRCVMPTRAQPGGLERELDVLRHLHAARGNDLGALATVARPGWIAVGDAVRALA